jgi:putative ABC transport system substrate-binding protein
MIGRREFITLLGGAAALPVAAPQQRTMPVIGLLSGQSAELYSSRLRAFHEGLKETGFVEGESVSIVYRAADNNLDRLPAMASDLVRRRVDVIVALAGSVLPAKAATATIPIVFNVNTDPVKLGLVASLSRPGGNLTGTNFLTAELTKKRLELLRELVPKAMRLAVLVNPSRPDTEVQLREIGEAARALALQVTAVNARTVPEIDAAFESLARDRLDALFVVGDPFFNVRRVQFALLAARHAVPSTYSLRDHIEVGGLMSYGTKLSETYRQVGVYVGRILKGAKPADLPVVQSTKFELVINAQAAKVLGLTVPSSLLSIADEVIE